jgi:hypothetical protein
LHPASNALTDTIADHARTLTAPGDSLSANFICKDAPGTDL